MKSIQELLTALAEHLQLMRDRDHLDVVNRTEWDKAQQLVGQIRWKLKEEQWKPR